MIVLSHTGAESGLREGNDSAHVSRESSRGDSTGPERAEQQSHRGHVAAGCRQQARQADRCKIAHIQAQTMPHPPTPSTHP